jgi:hypothetical protein
MRRHGFNRREPFSLSTLLAALALHIERAPGPQDRRKWTDERKIELMAAVSEAIFCRADGQPLRVPENEAELLAAVAERLRARADRRPARGLASEAEACRCLAGKRPWRGLIRDQGTRGRIARSRDPRNAAWHTLHRQLKAAHELLETDREFALAYFTRLAGPSR